MTTKTKTNKTPKLEHRRIVRIDDRLDRALRQRAEEVGISTSAFIRMALTAAVKAPKA